MKERPILFSGPMVRAILAGTKAQTRRPVKPQPEQYGEPDSWSHPATVGEPQWGAHLSDAIKWACPYGQPGDRLWVREPGRVIHYKGEWSGPLEVDAKVRLRYMADGKETDFVPFPKRLLRILDFGPAIGKGIDLPMWARNCQGIPNGIFREAARIFLEIVSVRVERLKDITTVDAQAEGFCGHGAIIPFIETWERIYGNRGLGCDANPWVWVVGLKRVEANA